MRKPAKRLPTFSFFTSPRTVPGATFGSCRDLTSPFTWAPSRVVMRPSSAMTSPPTRPVMRTLPCTTRTSPVTRPRMSRRPLPDVDVVIDRAVDHAGPSMETTGPFTTSPSATTTPPVTLMRRSLRREPSSAAPTASRSQRRRPPRAPTREAVCAWQSPPATRPQSLAQSLTGSKGPAGAPRPPEPRDRSASMTALRACGP